MREAEIDRKSLIRAIVDFVQNILPSTTPLIISTPKSEVQQDFNPALLYKTATPRSVDVSSSLSTATTSIYETPSPKTSSDMGGEIGEEEDVGDGDVTEKDVQQFGAEHFGELASPYVTPYLHNRSYLDKDFGIRKNDDGQFRIGNSLIEIDEHSNVIVQGREYKGTKGLFE
jgi:hypothetical protein